MTAMTDKIMRRVRGKGRGWTFGPKDFVDLGRRAAVDMALSRLTQSGAIRRVGRGVYDYPKQHPKLGALSPDTDALAQVVAARAGDQLAPSGAMAANRFGLSTQVPAKPVYATTGKSRTVTAGGRTLIFRHARAPVLPRATDTANATVQVLDHIGRQNLTDSLLGQIAVRLNDQDRAALHRARKDLPGWMSDALHKMEALQNG